MDGRIETRPNSFHFQLIPLAAISPIIVYPAHLNWFDFESKVKDGFFRRFIVEKIYLFTVRGGWLHSNLHVLM